MVQLASVAAINSDVEATLTLTGETAEAQEARISKLYANALQLQRNGAPAEAAVMFEQLLTEPALQLQRDTASGSFALAAEVRYLVLKNYAAALAREDDTCHRSLLMYVEASAMDSTDTVLWHSMGTLASELGHWGMARQAFESGLRCSPQHRMLTSKLLDVLLALGDWHALSDLLAYALKQDQCNPHALHVQSCLQQQTRGLLGKRSSSEPSTPQTTLLHQPLLKRRHMQPQQHTLWHDTLHHSIELSQPSWTSVAAALRQKLVKALSSGSAAACAVNFVLRVDESAKQTSPEQQMSTDVIPADIVAVEAVLENASAPASEGQATQTQAADAQLMSDDAKEAGEKRQRSSRRLGTSRTATESSPDPEAMQPAKNVLHLLASILPPQPVTQLLKSPLAALPVDATITSQQAATLPQPSADSEQAAVLDFVQKQTTNSGLLEVSAALLETLLSQPGHPDVKAAAEDLLQLEACVRGWSRSPQVALALAELYFSAAKQLAASKANSTGKPGAKKGTARTVKHKFNSSMHGCGANLGLFEAAMLQQHSRVSLTAAHPDTAATAMNSGSTSNRAVDQHHVSDAVVQSHQLQARYHWLQACISEHSKHLGDAAHQLEACMLAIDALSQISSKSQQEVSVAVSPPGAAAITAQAVTQKLDELNMLIMVQEGRKSLEQGQHQALISRLVPVLLSDTPDGLPMDVPHQLAGLQLLQEAAAKDASKSSWQLRLQCVLAAASLQLPPPLPPAVLSDTVQPQHAPDSPQTATQHARDTGIAASDTAPSEAATDTSPKAKVTSFSLSQDTYAAVTALNKALAGNLPAWLKELQAGSRQADALSRLLASVQWQLAGAIERLYIMLQSSAAAQSPSHPNLNIKESQQQACLLESLQALTWLKQLDQQMPAEPAIVLELLSLAASVLADAGTLGLRHGAYLQDCLHYITKQMPCSGCMSGVAKQILYLLYGLDLEGRDAQWADGVQGKQMGLDPQSRSDALQLWPYLKLFCTSLSAASRPLKQRLAGILTAIQTQLPAIPAAVLAHLDLNIVLDNLSGPDVIDLQALEQSVTEDPDRDVHSELYHLLTQCESDAPEWQTDGNAMLQEAGHQQVEESLQLTRFDLCYNFHRYESWEKVLNTYLTASHLLMTTAANDAQQAMTCKAWHDQPRLPERLHRYFARAEAAMGIARTAALLQADDPAQGQVVSSSSDKEIQQQQQQQQQARIEQLNANLAFIEENSGSLQLERVQNAPPIYNQMLLVPDKESTTYCQSCQVGLAAFSKAAQRLPDEWEFQLNLAKLLRKSGGSAQQVLWHLAKACCLAKLHNKGLIEPLYQLHALRLKLSAQDSADLELLGRYSFAPPVLAEPMQGDDQSSPQLALTDTDNTQEEADAAMQQASEHTQALQTALPAASTATQNPVWSDAMGALSWCLEHSKAGNHETYHKVRYRQAHALYSQGQHDVALQVLQPLFRKKGSNSFSINMYMISNGSSSKAYAAKSSSDLESEARSEAAQALPEALWGAQPSSVAGSGLDESPRKFVAHVRKCMLLYVRLLAHNGDLDALQAMLNTIKQPSWKAYADIYQWAYGMYLIHLAARLDPYSLQEEAPIAPVHFPAAAANTSPLFQLLQGAHELQTPDDTLTSLLEKAYALYAETCLGPESSTSWDALDPRLEAVIKFNPPAVLSHLSNDALSPEMFCMYATAYLWALGNAADAAKLQSIQHALKRRGAKRSSSQSEALQALSAAAPAAMQMALEKQFSKLQPEVHALLQRPAHTVPDNPAAPIDLLHTDQTLQSLLRTSAEPALPPIESHSQENAAVQIRSGQEQSIAEASAPQQEQQPMADAPVQQQIVASSEDRELPAEQQAEIAEATAVEPAALATTAVEDPAYRKLLASVFDMLKRCYTWWKSNAGKAVDAAHQTLPVDKVKADALLSRIYTTYMCLSYRQSGLAVTSVSEAAAGCEHLLQQVKHGADLPKPMLSAQEQVLERSVAQQNTLSATHD